MEGFITLIMSTGQPHGSSLHEVREYLSTTFTSIRVIYLSTLSTVYLCLLLSNAICH